MKYTKHFTWKEWKKFNKPVQPDNTFCFVNFHTKKKESYDSLTMQEVLLSKYKIILDEYEPKWTRRYHTFTKYVNQKNLDKSITSFNKAVNAFSNGLGDLEKPKTKGRSKKNQDVLWGKKKNDNIWGKSGSKKSNSLNIWNDDKKTSIW